MRTETSLAGRILDCLAAAGADTIFGLPGVHNLAFWRESGPDLPRIVGVRHEQTTVYAADGLARATGGLGVALTTTGPGAANALAAFGEAAASRSPVLLIATEIPSTLVRPGVVRGVLHESRDQAVMFAPLAKAVFTPRTPEQAGTDIGLAVQSALSSPRGPVYVDIPADLLDAPAAEIDIPAPTTPQPDPADIDRLAAEIAAARRVVIWAGGGVPAAGGEGALAALAERLHAPVVTSWPGRGALPPGHPWLVGLPPHDPGVATLIGAADLLLAVGTRFDGPTTRNWTMPTSRRLASINADPTAFAANYPADVTVHGDAALVLVALAERVTQRDGPNPIPELRRSGAERLAANPEHADPLRLVAAVEQAVDRQTSVLADMCVPGYWWAGYGAVAGPRRLQYPMGWGTLGYALPASVGAATAGGPVLVLCGDGGLMMGVGELATLAQEQLPVTVLVADDGGYGMLRYDQQRLGDPHRGVDLHTPDWTHLGAAFGIPVTVLDGIDERLAPALTRALAAGRPRLVVVQASMVPPPTTSPRWRD